MSGRREASREIMFLTRGGGAGRDVARADLRDSLLRRVPSRHVAYGAGAIADAEPDRVVVDASGPVDAAARAVAATVALVVDPLLAREPWGPDLRIHA